MLRNAPTLAIVAAHTDENEPARMQLRNNKITCTHYLIPRHTVLLKLNGTLRSFLGAADMAIQVEEDVLKLHVTVDDALGVEIPLHRRASIRGCDIM